MNARMNWLVPVVALVLVGVGVGARLMLQDIPNFAPVAALGLFAGYLMGRRRGAILVPLAIMAISDLAIGGYDGRLMTVVYASLALPALLGRWLQPRLAMDGWGSSCRSSALLVGASLASSIMFFVTTNFAVWAFGSMYESSSGGLVHCYVRALPFFRYTLAGDLFFSVALFTGLALVRSLWPQPALLPREVVA